MVGWQIVSFRQPGSLGIEPGTVLHCGGSHRGDQQHSHMYTHDAYTGKSRKLRNMSSGFIAKCFYIHMVTIMATGKKW